VACKLRLTSSTNHWCCRHLFLGRALDRQGKYDEAVKIYHKAATIKHDDESPWLGLRTVYEAQGSAKVDEYIEASLKLAQAYEAKYVSHWSAYFMD
jgi:superkiller protein 3